MELITVRSALGSGLALAMLLQLGACGNERPSSAEHRASRSTAALTVNDCSPVAGHPKHAGASCTTCHQCSGASPDGSGVVFDPAGRAVAAGQAAPAFDKTAKTCSNVACHGVAAGSFSYYFPGGDGEPVLNTISYGGAFQPTPSWLTTGLRCDGCHGNPPRNAVWHSGYHANQGPAGAYNQCQYCHPDATGANGVGTAITNPLLHGNKQVEVAARYRSSCFGCH